MLYYIKGALKRKFEDSIVVEANGLGYEAFVSAKTVENLTKIGERVKIYTYTHNKEDGVTLYGFLSEEELWTFRMLITVSGVGPKAALAILSVMEPDDIKAAIAGENTAALEQARGIGKKAAQRLVLELKDKIGAAPGDGRQVFDMAKVSERRDAVEALVALGFGRSEALKGVMETAVEGMTSEQIIKQTLRRLSS
jgi:Holliday junction DNA helicase RuvA